MERYYSGSIEGKFMFAVQNSNAADRFGVTGKSNQIEYYFDEYNIEDIKLELKTLKDVFEVVNKFFENRNGYTIQEIAEHSITRDMLIDYADYVLGKQILDCINEEGSCFFTAEL